MIPASAAVIFEDEDLETIPDPDMEEAPEEDILFDDDDPNLVLTFQRSNKGRNALKRISDHIMGEFKMAWDDSAPYRDHWMKNWKLRVGELPPKDKGYEFCANVNIPTSLENTARVELRLYGEMFDDFKNVVNFVSLNKEDRTAPVLSKHSNWQFRVQIPDFKRQMHRACAAFVHIGDWVCHSYYDPHRKQNRHEILTPDQFVVPWARQTTMPDLSDLPWYCRISELHVHELQARRGSWADIDWLLQEYQASHSDEPEQETDEPLTEDDPTPNDATKYAPFKVLWWEGWMELPGRPDQHWIQAHVHQASGRILMMKVHEEAHWQDLQRFELQVAERDAYRQQRSAWQMQRDQVEEKFTRADDYVDALVDEEMVQPDLAFGGMAEVDRQRQEALAPIDAQEPQPPAWMDGPEGEPERPRRTPVYMFTHAVCLEPLVGNRGLSYGRIQADLQRAINALINQYIDAGTFGNINSFIATKDLQFKGNLQLKPGKINYAEGANIEDIRKHFMPLATGNANPQMMEVANLLMEKAQKSMQAAEILSGEPGKSGETYKGVAARIEQATKQLSVLGRKMGDAVAQIARNNARLNSIFLREEELIQIADIRGSEPIKVGRGMYQQNYAVEISADMRFATNVQKVAEAQEFLGQIMELSQPGGPLMGNLLIQYHAVVDLFRALRQDRYVEYLGMPPQAPPPQFGPPPPPQPPPEQAGPPGQGGPPQGPPPGMPPGGQQ